MKKLTVLLALTAFGAAIRWGYEDHRVFSIYLIAVTFCIARYLYKDWQQDEKIRKEPILMEQAKAENARLKLELENAELAQKASWTGFMKS